MVIMTERAKKIVPTLVVIVAVILFVAGVWHTRSVAAISAAELAIRDQAMQQELQTAQARDAEYRRILNQRETHEDAALTAESTTFLAAIKSDDPRGPQVASFFGDCVLREMLRLAQTGRTDECKALYQHYEQVVSRFPRRVPAAETAATDDAVTFISSH